MVQASAAGVLGGTAPRLRVWRSPAHMGQRQVSPVRPIDQNSQGAFLFRAKCVSTGNDTSCVSVIVFQNLVADKLYSPRRSGRDSQRLLQHRKRLTEQPQDH